MWKEKKGRAATTFRQQAGTVGKGLVLLPRRTEHVAAGGPLLYLLGRRSSAKGRLAGPDFVVWLLSLGSKACVIACIRQANAFFWGLTILQPAACLIFCLTEQNMHFVCAAVAAAFERL